MTEQSGVGRTLPRLLSSSSDAFEVDFDPAFLSMKRKSKSKAADKPALSEVEESVRSTQARS